MHFFNECLEVMSSFTKTILLVFSFFDKLFFNFFHRFSLMSAITAMPFCFTTVLTNFFPATPAAPVITMTLLFSNLSLIFFFLIYHLYLLYI